MAFWNVPNSVTLMRFPLTVIMWYYAVIGNNRTVGLLLILALLTDFFDGFLARLLKQETDFGAKFDAIADMVLNISMIIWIPLLLSDLLTELKMVLIIAISSYLITLGYGFIKYKKAPTFHLWSNKVTLAIAGTFIAHALIFGFSRVFGYVSAGCVILMSIEQVIATHKLDRPDEKIKTVFELF